MSTLPSALTTLTKPNPPPPTTSLMKRTSVFHDLFIQKYEQLIKSDINWSDVSDTEKRLIAVSRIKRNIHEDMKSSPNDLFKMLFKLGYPNPSTTKERIRSEYKKMTELNGFMRFDAYPLSSHEIAVKSIYHIVNDYDLNDENKKKFEGESPPWFTAISLDDIEKLITLDQKLDRFYILDKSKWQLPRRLIKNFEHWVHLSSEGSITNTDEEESIDHYNDDDRVVSTSQTCLEALFMAIYRVKMGIDRGVPASEIVETILKLKLDTTGIATNIKVKKELKAIETYIAASDDNIAPLKADEIAVLAYSRAGSLLDLDDCSDDDSDSVMSGSEDETEKVDPIIKYCTVSGGLKPEYVKIMNDCQEELKRSCGSKASIKGETMDGHDDGISYVRFRLNVESRFLKHKAVLTLKKILGDDLIIEEGIKGKLFYSCGGF